MLTCAFAYAKIDITKRDKVKQRKSGQCGKRSKPMEKEKILMDP